MKKLLLIICSLVLLQQLIAQQPDLVFHHTTQKDGLSFNVINCFLKDSRGMLWIGTYDGLNRYDGAHFYIYRKGKNKNSLPDNAVQKLAEDKKGNIWGVTDDGVFCYNQQKNSFTNYHTPGEKDWGGLLSIICDAAGIIWATNAYCLVKYNENTDSFERAPILKNGKEVLLDFTVRKNGMAESPDKKGFWLTTAEGLFYYDKTLRQLETGQNNKDTLLFSGKSASALCATPYGHFWYYDNVKKRMLCFDPVAKKVIRSIESKEFEKNNSVATIFEDNNHILWVSTWEYNVYTIDYLHGNKITRIRNDKSNLSSIAGDFFWDAMQEDDGTVWLGTYGGISKCNTKKLFYKVHNLADSLFAFPNPAFGRLSENRRDSTWWIPTTKRKLLQYYPSTSKIVSYDLDKMPLNAKGLAPRKVNKMLFLQNKVYLFTDNGAWLKEGNTAFKVLKIPSIPDSVILREGVFLNDSVMYCTDYSRVWKWNQISNKVTEVKYQTQITINGNPPYAKFFTLAKNKIWLLSGDGWVSHINNTVLVPVNFITENSNRNNGEYLSMTSDVSGNLWIAKKGDGLLYYNPADNIYKRYKQYDGLAIDHIMAVAEDRTGKIWTACYNQFSIFNPQLKSFYNFTLPISTNNYLYVNYISTLSNGNVLCNIANKLVEFFPDKIQTSVAATQPLISSLSISGVEQILSGNNSVSLSAKENSLFFKFGLLANNETAPYDMLYIMEGAENNWSVSNAGYEASYNNLPPGNYTFKIKAVAKDKSWQTKETVLPIHIATPFYKSWWFFLLIACAIAGAVYFFYRYRLGRQQQVMLLENKAQQLEKEKTMVMYESLKQQLNPHFLFNSLTSLSGLIETNQQVAGNFLEQMSGIYRYILKNGDTETVTIKDEISFVKLYISLQQTRFKKGLQINIMVPDDYLHYKIAPVTLQNLIENAIKHNIIDEEAPLVIDIFIEQDYVVVKNNLQKKNMVETSNKKGLAQFETLYKYLSDKPIFIEETNQYFTIKIPLI
jgi:ligand-binding sensor domain-containing protein